MAGGELKVIVVVVVVRILTTMVSLFDTLSAKVTALDAGGVDLGEAEVKDPRSFGAEATEVTDDVTDEEHVSKREFVGHRGGEMC